MKNLFLSLLVASAAVACNSTMSTVSDTADANAPAGDCSGCATECATGCSDAQKAECSAAKTCPVTGETIEG